MDKFIPDVERLRRDVSSIFIDESMDYDYTLSRLIYHLDPTIPENKHDLTYEGILSKYKSHILQWNENYREKEKRGWLGKADAGKRKNLLEFLDARLYMIEWDSLSATANRDHYLFGSVNHHLLTEQRKAFVEGLKIHGV